jgi:hypothetical protein
MYEETPTDGMEDETEQINGMGSGDHTQFGNSDSILKDMFQVLKNTKTLSRHVKNYQCILLMSQVLFKNHTVLF